MCFFVSCLIACINLQSSHGAQVQVCGWAVPWLDLLSVSFISVFLYCDEPCVFLFCVFLWFKNFYYLWLIATTMVFEPCVFTLHRRLLNCTASQHLTFSRDNISAMLLRL